MRFNLAAEDMRLSGEELRFMEELLTRQGATDIERGNDHVHALIKAGLEAFDGSGGRTVEVNPLFVQKMLRSIQFVSRVDAHEHIPFFMSGSDVYTCVYDVLVGLMDYCRDMIRQGNVYDRPAGTYVGSFLVPAWFVEQVRTACAQTE